MRIGASSNAVVYTVPADRTALIRTITMSNLAAVAQHAVVTVDRGSGTRRLVQAVIPANESYVLDAPVALDEGDIVQCFNQSAGGSIDFYGGGSLLLGDPS